MHFRADEQHLRRILTSLCPFCRILFFCLTFQRYFVCINQTIKFFRSTSSCWINFFLEVTNRKKEYMEQKLLYQMNPFS